LHLVVTIIRIASAQTNTLIYKRELTLTLIYTYKVNSVGKIKNKMELIKVY